MIYFHKRVFFLLLIIFPSLSFSMLPVIDVAALIQLGDQLLQIKQQTEYIANELEQLKNSQYQWSNAQSLINNLGNIINQENTLAYSAANSDTKFRQAYPGYQAPQNFSKQYADNTAMTLNTLDSVLKSLGSSAQDFQNENARLAFLQNQAQSAQGQTQAIQASAQIASEMVSQTQLLRQTVLAQTNAQTVYFANQTQNDASSKAELSQIITSGSTNIPGYGTSGQSLSAPDY